MKLSDAIEGQNVVTEKREWERIRLTDDWALLVVAGAKRKRELGIGGGLSACISNDSPMGG